ncbi:hypothetical protein GCM10011492_22900 [Flexivirga endophytica]|uniref:Uncharacterized protein n=1 Tax=Flexivirga endophytica TaxID=1849103 RepID=A0A916T5X6_9MICO|nr:hypothetical protein [Flexivirga endophytica]GGB31673.1 hypothetical protein GCM10011492_22900 [Flexivirga endophytica]GHB52610.1 hypothetical protein GCM10008112_22170 [Flexivirga endophytica]
MTTGDKTRPDGRVSSAETLELRKATRALRLHLDELPIDYDEQVPPDRFLTGLAFMLARNRYDCAESMIGSGFGGTVIGALARSLLTDGLRWLWIAQDPKNRRACLLGDLVEERSRLGGVLDSGTCPAVRRWLMPFPPIADLTGASRTWLDAPATPDEGALLDDLFSAVEGAPSSPGSENSTGIGVFVARAHAMLDLAGLRGAAMILAHAGHGNYLGQRSTLTEEGAPGFDLRPDHEALFMHTAAVGAFCVLVGGTAAAPDAWPHDVDQGSFLTTAAKLTEDVAEAAAVIHRVAARNKPRSQTAKPPAARKPTVLMPTVVMEDDEVLAERYDLGALMQDLEDACNVFCDVLNSMKPHTELPAELPIHVYLNFGASLSYVQTVFDTCDQMGASTISSFAARALLEEAARMNWRYNDPGLAPARAKQYFDEHRFMERKTIRTLAGRGINKKDALRLFSMPANVLVPPGADAIAKNREPLPSTASMLRNLGAGANDPGWFETAYGLLSQITHATPLGMLHNVRYIEGDSGEGQWVPNQLSGEMMALTLDVAALAGAQLVGTGGALMSDLSQDAKEIYFRLHAVAAEIHRRARLIHGLDLPTDPISSA